MIKCTEATFLEFSPSKFFRRHKNGNIPEEEYQIYEQSIIEKLKLILISMREEARRASIFFDIQNSKLQQKTNYQTRLVNFLEEENLLLTKLMEVYIEKYGQIGPEIQKIQKTKEARMKFYAEHQIATDENNFDNRTKRVDEKNSSQLRTNQMDGFWDTSNLELQRMNEQMKISFSSSSMVSEDQDTSPTSTSSKFYKKPNPYNSSTAQTKNCNLFLSSLLPESKQCSTKVSSTNNYQEYQAVKQEINECHSLGLNSKGSNFFEPSQPSYLNHTIEDFNIVNLNFQLIPECLQQVKSNINDCPKSDDVFQSLKTDSDIKRIKLELQMYFPNSHYLNKRQTNGTKSIFHPISSNLFDSKKELKNLNHSYSESLQFKSKRTPQKDEIIQQKNSQKHENTKQVQSMSKELNIVDKKLRALFGPLSSDLISKKVSLPKLNQQFKNDFGRQSVDEEKLNRIFNNIKIKAPKFEYIGSKENKQRN